MHDIFASFAGVPKYLYDLFLKGEPLIFLIHCLVILKSFKKNLENGKN